jgi:ATP synthase protein I
MLANYAKIARRSGAVALAVAAVMAAICTAVGGSKGLLAAGIAAAVVAFFFGLSVLVVGRAARVSPQAMMGAGVGVYLFKIVVLLALVGQFQDTTAFNGKLFGITVLVLVLAYSAAQVLWSMKLKALYVEPDGER